MTSHRSITHAAPAELVRVAADAMSPTTAGVTLSVTHMKDRSWALVNDFPLPAYDECLAAGALGCGFFALAGRSPSLPATTDFRRVESSSAKDAVSWTGGAIFNPSFLYDAARYTESAILLRRSPGGVSLADAAELTDVLKFVAERATELDAPLLFVQAPAAPPHRNFNSEEWRRANSLAVRFSIAVSESRPSDLLVLRSKIVEYCLDRGFGYYETDRRFGQRNGEWFAVVLESASKYAGRKLDYSDADRAQQPLRIVPLTVTGPARVGTTNEVLKFLTANGVHIASASITSIADQSIIHLGLAGTRRGRDDQVESGSADRLREIVRMVRPVPLPPAFVAPPVLSDYQFVAGPPVLADASLDRDRGSVWIGWDLPGADPGSLGVLLTALGTAFAKVLGQGPAEEIDPNIDYLVSRELSHGSTAGRAKISVSMTDVQGTMHRAYPDSHDFRTDFCRRLEAAWKVEVSTSALGLVKVSQGRSLDLAVVWRETYLGRWANLHGRSR